MSAIEFGFLFYGCNLGAPLAKSDQKLLADIGMCHFATAEAHGNLNAVAFSEEFHRVAHFGVKVIRVDARRHTNLLDLDNTLVFLRFLFPFELVKAEFAVIHDLADGWHGVRGDLDKVKLLLLSHFQRCLGRNDSEHCAVRADQANFLVPNFFVELMI